MFSFVIEIISRRTIARLRKAAARHACNFASGVCLVLLPLVGILAVSPALAQPYPNRPIRVIVPYSAGSTADVLARAMADYMSKRIGQSVIVENKTGANSILGAEIANNSPPDGYTFVNLNDAAAALNPVIYPKLPYDTLRDFVPLSFAGDVRMALVANPDFPAKNFKEFVALARARPNTINFASGGTGSAHHVLMEMIMQGTDTQLVHVPYKGAGPAMADILAGHVNVGVVGLAAALPHINSGKLRPLAVTNAARLSALPDVPTLSELGVSGFPFEPWTAFFAPIGIPEPTLSTLTRAVAEAIDAPEVRAKVGAALDMRSSSPDDLRNIVERDRKRYVELAKRTKLASEN